jgi:hypothetical protein
MWIKSIHLPYPLQPKLSTRNGKVNEEILRHHNRLAILYSMRIILNCSEELQKLENYKEEMFFRPDKKPVQYLFAGNIS